MLISSKNKKKNYLVFSATDWSENKVSIMHLASILSENNNVIFFQTYGRRFPKIKDFPRIIKRLTNKNYYLGNNLKVVSVLGFPYSKLKFLNMINSYIINLQIKKKISIYDKYNVIVSSPIWLDIIIKNKIHFLKITFHCVDNLFTYISHNQFKKDFNSLVNISNNLVTPNRLINKKLFKNNAIILENATNFKKNLSINKFPYNSKNIVYSGTLANWVDYDLLNNLILNLSTYNFYFVGYIHPLVKSNSLKFLNHPNVVFFKKVNYSNLPSIYNSCHIGIIPYEKDNEHIKYSSPTKLHDYISSNLKIVSTEIPYVQQFMNKYKDLKIASNVNEFTESITRFESDKKDNNILEFENDWKGKKEKVLQIF